MTLWRRLAKLERAAKERGPGGVDFVIVDFGDGTGEVLSNTARLRAPGGALCVPFGELETAEDAIARFVPVERTS